MSQKTAIDLLNEIDPTIYQAFSPLSAPIIPELLPISPDKRVNFHSPVYTDAQIVTNIVFSVTFHPDNEVTTHFRLSRSIKGVGEEFEHAIWGENKHDMRQSVIDGFNKMFIWEDITADEFFDNLEITPFIEAVIEARCKLNVDAPSPSNKNTPKMGV